MDAGDWSPIITEIVEVPEVRMKFKRQLVSTNSKRDGTTERPGKRQEIGVVQPRKPPQAPNVCCGQQGDTNQQPLRDRFGPNLRHPGQLNS
jgi:hypothetical protein